MNPPDISKGYELIDKIRELAIKKAKLELAIKASRAAIVTKVMSDRSYWTNGKPPSMAYISETYLITGIDGVDLLELRKELSEVSTELDYYKAKLEMFKLEVEVWRTQSANERALSM